MTELFRAADLDGDHLDVHGSGDGKAVLVVSNVEKGRRGRGVLAVSVELSPADVDGLVRALERYQQPDATTTPPTDSETPDA